MTRRFPRLRKWMRANRYKQYHVAGMAQMDQSKLSRIFRGEDDFDFDESLRMELATGIQAEYFMATNEARILLKVYGERLLASGGNAK